MQERTEPLFYSTNEIFDEGLTSKVCLSIIYINVSPFCVTKRKSLCVLLIVKGVRSGHLSWGLKLKGKRKDGMFIFN